MKYCPDPECPASRAGEAVRQYRDDLEYCSACGTVLVAAPDLAPKPGEELVVLDRFSLAHEAHMAQALLASERIHAVVQQDHGPFVGMGMGAVVMVPESYLDIAKKVLEQGPAGMPEEIELEEPEDEATQQAARVRKIGRAARYVAFLAILYAVVGTFFGFANLTRVNNLRTELAFTPDEFPAPERLYRDGYEDLLLDPETGERRSAGEVRADLRRHSVAGFLVGYILAFTFASLYFWAKKSPVPALIVALCVYVMWLVVEAILEPATIVQAWFLKALVIAALVTGVRQAVQETAYRESLETAALPDH